MTARVSLREAGKPRWVVAHASDLVIELKDPAIVRLVDSKILLPSLGYISMYMTASHHPHPKHYANLFQGADTADWILPRVASRSTPVYLRVYLVRTNSDKAPCAFEGARATLTLGDLVGKSTHELRAQNERGTVVATVRLTVQLDATTPFEWVERDPDTAPDPSEIESLPRFFDPRRRFLGKYAPVNEQVGRLVNEVTPTFFCDKTPKWMLARLTETGIGRTSQEYWRSAIAIACCMLDLEVAAFAADPLRAPEVLGQVVGLQAWQTPYLADGTFDGVDFCMYGKFWPVISNFGYSLRCLLVCFEFWLRRGG